MEEGSEESSKEDDEDNGWARSGRCGCSSFNGGVAAGSCVDRNGERQRAHSEVVQFTGRADRRGGYGRVAVAALSLGGKLATANSIEAFAMAVKQEEEERVRPDEKTRRDSEMERFLHTMASAPTRAVKKNVGRSARSSERPT